MALPKPDKRTARIEMRVTPEEKRALELKAIQTRRTLSSIIAQLIDEMDKIIP